VDAGQAEGLQRRQRAHKALESDEAPQPGLVDPEVREHRQARRERLVDPGHRNDPAARVPRKLERHQVRQAPFYQRPRDLRDGHGGARALRRVPHVEEEPSDVPREVRRRGEHVCEGLDAELGDARGAVIRELVGRPADMESPTTEECALGGVGPPAAHESAVGKGGGVVDELLEDELEREGGEGSHGMGCEKFGCLPGHTLSLMSGRHAFGGDETGTASPRLIQHIAASQCSSCQRMTGHDGEHLKYNHAELRGTHVSH
jgi:hypothetical protein